ncbi:MAG: carbon-nitrogen hydrolase family protein [Gemmatimonadetes bacterium]|jgi:beta-ureidopropionase|nr:carbon-nitrogen hydrolase family protein [Gemmatimonadota bacterium]
MREVWIACITQTGLQADTIEQMCDKFIDRMAQFAPMTPDIYCLPEGFPGVNLSIPRPPSRELAEIPPGPITERFAAFAKEHNTYVICPIYTRDEEGHCYNAAVVIDRSGNVLGEYRKTHLTDGEMEGFLTPGPLDPPIFETDFGTIGIQICFDIEWADGWQTLRDKHADLVFWPSAFAGGDKLNQLAINHHYAIAASTRKGSTRIIDIDGQTIAATGIWDPKGVCMPLNLEKAFLHTYPHQKHFDDIRAKYGRDILIKTYHDEEWTIVESRAPGLNVADVLAEFDIQTHDEMTATAEAMQQARRPDRLA